MVFWYFFNLILVIFIILLVSSWERKGRSPDSGGRERKLSLTFFFMMEVHIRCIFLLLKFVKKHIWVRVDFWFWVDFCFFEVIDKFIMIPIVFYTCFGLRINFKISFWIKNLKPWFFNHNSDWNLGKTIQWVVWIFFSKIFLWWTIYLQQKK